MLEKAAPADRHSVVDYPRRGRGRVRHLLVPGDGGASGGGSLASGGAGVEQHEVVLSHQCQTAD